MYKTHTITGRSFLKSCKKGEQEEEKENAVALTMGSKLFEISYSIKFIYYEITTAPAFFDITK